MHEGPAARLTRQHKFTKTAVGWIRTEVAKPDVTPTGQFDDTSGSSAEKVEELAKPWSIEQPLEAQQVVQRESKKWSAEGQADGLTTHEKVNVPETKTNTQQNCQWPEKR